MNHCLEAFQFLEQCGEVTGGHTSYLNTIGKVHIIGIPTPLLPWICVIGSYAGRISQGSDHTCNTFLLAAHFFPFAFFFF